MGLNQQSIGSLLFLLENAYLKNEIRNSEKLNKRLIHIKSGINFINIYVKEGLQPTFTNIYINMSKLISSMNTFHIIRTFSDHT